MLFRSELSLTYTRGGVATTGTITAKLHETEDVFGNIIKIGLIGVTSDAVEYKELSAWGSVKASVEETFSITERTLIALGQMITGQRSADQISGILRIADYSGQSVDQGLRTVFWFMAILSINLGLINLFPIPMLDGGHLFFYGIEAVRRKPLSERAQEYFFRAGFTALIMLMIFATFNDLKHFGIF